ncbi:MAG: AAA family ATPase [Candidatus Gastranaerophilales bacterium]|nr:AAA family ATPase [Candidatus Gastranaerophilales bacterium]
MQKKFVKTQNVKKLISLINNLNSRPAGIPGMALVYGEPGLGKTQAVLWWAAHNDVIFIRGTNLMTSRWLLEEIVEELGEEPYFKTSDLFKQCIKQLKEKPRLIIVDEIDYLATDYKAIETLRDIHDKSNAPILLVGMGQADKKIMRYKHLYDRISEKLKFKPFSQEDVKNIILQLCEVEMTDCAIKFVFEKTNRFRQLVKFIRKAEEIAKANNLSTLDEFTLKELINYESGEIDNAVKKTK